MGGEISALVQSTIGETTMTIEIVNNPETRYKIVKFRKSGTQSTMERNLTLDEAKRYCNRPDTRGKNWFCGFTKQ